MRDHLDQFADADATVAVVTFTDPGRLAAYRSHLRLPFDVLADPDRELYRGLDVVRGTRRQVWSAGTLRMYARLLRKGRRLRRPTEDIRQLGADVVVDRHGTILYLARPDSPDARPPITELTAALR